MIRLDYEGDEKGALKLQPARVPEHEPWLQHENSDPLEFDPEKTRAGLKDEQKDVVTPPVRDAFNLN